MSKWFGGRRGNRRVFAVLLVGALLVEIGGAMLVPLLRAEAATVTLTGSIGVIYAHPVAGTRLPIADTRYFLTDTAAGTRSELLIDDNVLRAAGGLAALTNREVSVTANTGIGPFAVGNGPLIATAIQAGRSFRPLATVEGAQAFVNLLCKFNDVAAEPEPKSYFDLLMGDGPNALGPYWNEVSYSKINITGSATFGWYTLPKASTAYVKTNGSGDFDEALLLKDCTDVATNATVNFTPYVGINIMFNKEIANYALGGYSNLTLSGVTRRWGQTWLLPPAYHFQEGSPYSGPATMAHEMGHAFALGHSAGPNGEAYGNSWDVMSGGDEFCRTRQRPCSVAPGSI